MKALKNYLETEDFQVISAFAVLCILSLLISFIITFTWFMFESIIRVPDHLTNIVDLIVKTFGSTYVGMVVYSFYKTNNQYTELNSLIESNRDTIKAYSSISNFIVNPKNKIGSEFIDEIKELRKNYLKICYNRTSQPFHIIMVILSGIVLFSNMTSKYESMTGGFTWIFMVVFAMAFSFGFTKIFENPVDGPIKIKKIPLNWIHDKI